MKAFLQSLHGDEKTGAEIVIKALEAPMRQIAANAGLEGSVIVNKVKDMADGVGFDALNEKYVDMVEAGIVDSYKGNKNSSPERYISCINIPYNRGCCCRTSQ